MSVLLRCLLGGTLLALTLWTAFDWLTLWKPPPLPHREPSAELWQQQRGDQRLLQVAGTPYSSAKALGYATLTDDTGPDHHLARLITGDASSPWAPHLRRKAALLLLRDVEPHLLPRERLALLGLAHSQRHRLESAFGHLVPPYTAAAARQLATEIVERLEARPSTESALVAVGGSRGQDGHALLARNLYRDGPHGPAPAVQTVRPTGGLHGYVAVGPPGQLGVLAGLNQEGLAVVVYQRASAAGEPWRGLPASWLARRALEEASTIEAALPLLTNTPTFTHAVVALAEANGRVAVLELAPGRHTVREGELLAATEEAARVEAAPSSASAARQRRLESLLIRYPPQHRLDAPQLLEILRDRRAHSGEALPLGHRHAIDPLLVAQSVIIDATARTLWVAEGPHTLGPYRGYHVPTLLSQPNPAGWRPDLPADPLLSMHPLVERARRAWARAETHLNQGDPSGAREALRHTAALGDHPRTLLLRGRLAQAKGDAAWAAEFFRQALLAPPEMGTQHELVRELLASVKSERPIE